MKSNEVIVKFGAAVPPMVQAKAMFDMQLWLKKQGYDVNVFGETRPDDSRLRALMTKEQRDRL
jgi:hypothetical protein